MTKVKQGTIIYYTKTDEGHKSESAYIVISVDEPQTDMVLAMRISQYGYNSMARLLINKNNIKNNKFSEYENLRLEDVENYTSDYLYELMYH